MGGEISVTGAAVVALTTSDVVSITFRSWMLTGWASAHRYRMYPAPNNFTNSSLIGASVMRWRFSFSGVRSRQQRRQRTSPSFATTNSSFCFPRGRTSTTPMQNATRVSRTRSPWVRRSGRGRPSGTIRWWKYHAEALTNGQTVFCAPYRRPAHRHESPATDTAGCKGT